MKKILISAAVLMICLSDLWSSDSITIDKKDFQQVDWVSLYQTGKNVDVVTDEGTINSEIVLVDKDVYSYDAVWSWTYPNEVDEFTYKVNGGSWHTVDGDVFSVKTKRLNIGELSVLDVYASKNGID